MKAFTREVPHNQNAYGRVTAVSDRHVDVRLERGGSLRNVPVARHIQSVSVEDRVLLVWDEKARFWLCQGVYNRDGTIDDTVQAIADGAGHEHDSRYYVESEVDALLASKSSTGHGHGDAYAGAAHTHLEEDISDLEHDALKLRGRAVAEDAPTAGQALVWDDGGATWTPGDVASGGPHTHVESDVTDLEHNALKLQGRTLAATAPTEGQAIGWDNAGATWKPITVTSGAHTHVEADVTDLAHNATKIQSRNVAEEAPTDGQALAWDNAGSTWKPITIAGGGPHTHVEADVTNLDHNATKLQGRTLVATAPTTGHPILWNGSQWGPGGANVNLGSNSLVGNNGSVGLQIASTGELGINTAPVTGQTIRATPTITTLSGTLTPINTAPVFLPASDDAIALWAHSFNHSPAYSGTFAKGGYLSGLYVNPRVTSTGGIIIRGVDIVFSNLSTAVVPFVSGLRLRTPVNSGGGSITTAYGIFLENQNIAGTNYAIYTNSGPNRFGDAIIIAGNNPIKPESDSTTAIRITKAGGTNVLVVDTTSSIVTVTGTVTSSGLMTSAGHTLTGGVKLDLGTGKLVGNGGSTGIYILGDGTVQMTSRCQMNGYTNTGTASVDMGDGKLVGGGGSLGFRIYSTGNVTLDGALTMAGAILTGGIKLDLGTSSLVGNGGTTGFTITSGGASTLVGRMTAAGFTSTGGQKIDLGTGKLTGNGGSTGIGILGDGTVQMTSRCQMVGFSNIGTATVDMGDGKLVGGGGALGMLLLSNGNVVMDGRLTVAGAVMSGGIKLDLGTSKLVGNDGTVGLSIAAGGAATFGGALTVTGLLTTAGFALSSGNFDLGTGKLVGNGGSAGISVANSGYVAMGATVTPTQALHITDGSLLMESTGETAIYYKRNVTYTNSHASSPFPNPRFQFGRIIEAGDGAPNLRFLYTDDVHSEVSVMELDSEGILASVRRPGSPGAHFEGSFSGGAHPLFRINSYPTSRIQFGDGATQTDVSVGRTSVGRLGMFVSGVEYAAVTSGGLTAAGITNTGTYVNIGAGTLVGNAGTVGLVMAAGGEIGVNSAPITGTRLRVKDAITALSSTRTTFQVESTYTPASDDGSPLYGLAFGMYAQYNTTVNKTGWISGIYLNPTIVNTGTIAVRGLDIAIQNTGGAALPGIRGINVRNPTNSGGGTMTSFSGLYVEAITTAAANFAIYTAGAGLNRFGDAVVLGASSWIRPESNSTSAIRFRNATDTTIASFDTTNGRFAVGSAVPTAAVHIKAGAAGAGNAPLKLESGTNLTTPEAGVVEYNGRFTVTESDAARRFLMQAASATVTASAALVGDGYITVKINGTDVKLVTTT